MNEMTPMGWYPDNADPSLRRYWDGQKWTSQTMDASGNIQTTKPAKKAKRKAKVVAIVIGSVVALGAFGALLPEPDEKTASVTTATASPTTESGIRYPAPLTPAELRAKEAAEAKAANEAKRARLEAEKAAMKARIQAEAWKAGYTDLSEFDGVAFKWLDGGCSYLRCWRMKVVVRDGCEHLYVELTMEDSAGNKIGYTNDVLTGLEAGDTGIMEFTVTDDAADSASVNKINCY